MRRLDYIRQSIWERIREQNGKWWRIEDVRGDATVDQAHRFVGALKQLGYVDVEPRSDGCWRYRLAHDVGANAPDLSDALGRAHTGRWQHQLWLALRIVGTGTARDFAAAASTEETPVKQEQTRRYLAALARAGYVRRRGQQYQAIPARITGPEAPVVSRITEVRDPNRGGEVVWRGGGS